MNSAPPDRRGLDASQELRSPQEAISSLEPGQQRRHYRARDVSLRHRCAREQLMNFSDTGLRDVSTGVVLLQLL